MTHKYQEMHPAQVRNVLKFIDGSQSETIKESIFSQLGYCTSSEQMGHLDV